MLWKLYPYEWINHNLNGETEILNDLASLNIIEPAWKLILGCKNILPLLWEMFPNHPNLIPTYYESDKDKLTADKIWVAKTLYGRGKYNIYLISF
jgi:glutathionylspermidine synthase